MQHFQLRDDPRLPLDRPSNEPKPSDDLALAWAVGLLSGIFWREILTIALNALRGNV